MLICMKCPIFCNDVAKLHIVCYNFIIGSSIMTDNKCNRCVVGRVIIIIMLYLLRSSGLMRSGRKRGVDV